MRIFTKDPGKMPVAPWVVPCGGCGGGKKSLLHEEVRPRVMSQSPALSLTTIVIDYLPKSMCQRLGPQGGCGSLEKQILIEMSFLAGERAPLIR